MKSKRFQVIIFGDDQVVEAGVQVVNEGEDGEVSGQYFPTGRYDGKTGEGAAQLARMGQEAAQRAVGVPS